MSWKFLDGQGDKGHCSQSEHHHPRSEQRRHLWARDSTLSIVVKVLAHGRSGRHVGGEPNAVRG